CGVGGISPAGSQACGLIRRKAAAVCEHNSNLGVGLENTAKKKTSRTNRRVEWIPNQIVEVIGLHAVSASNIVRMHKHKCTKVLGSRPKRLETRVVKVLSHDVRGDHGSAQPELGHRAPEFAGGLLGCLHR